LKQAVAFDCPGSVAHEHARGTMRDLAGPRPVALADLVEQRRSARLGQELAAVADQARAPGSTYSRRTRPSASVDICFEPALRRQRLLDLADVVGRDVDRDPLVRLLDPVASRAGSPPARGGQLVALAPASAR
jgi:hypothetical protein